MQTKSLKPFTVKKKIQSLKIHKIAHLLKLEKTSTQQFDY